MSQDWDGFKRVVESRRSVRVYDGTPMPESAVQECLDMALLAPNSSNLQPWVFYWVRDLDKRKKLVEACLSQPTAKTAAELIVLVARTGTWRENARRMLAKLSEGDQQVPDYAKNYYSKVLPIFMTQGPFSILGHLKKIGVSIAGIFRPIPREPMNRGDVKIWAVKSTALAAQSLMLAARARGFDSCPMEGFDSFRVRALLNLPSDAVITMIISLGKRAPNGIYGPRLRFDRSEFVKIV